MLIKWHFYEAFDKNRLGPSEVHYRLITYQINKNKKGLNPLQGPLDKQIGIARVQTKGLNPML